MRHTISSYLWATYTLLGLLSPRWRCTATHAHISSWYKVTDRITAVDRFRGTIRPLRNQSHAYCFMKSCLRSGYTRSRITFSVLLISVGTSLSTRWSLFMMLGKSKDFAKRTNSPVSLCDRVCEQMPSRTAQQSCSSQPAESKGNIQSIARRDLGIHVIFPEDQICLYLNSTFSQFNTFA